MRKRHVFRQSWINTFHICPERGRLSIVLPEYDSLDSDSAVIGTAAHAGIEAVLRGGMESDAVEAILASIPEDQSTVKWSTHSTLDELREQAVEHFKLWHDRIRPDVPPGGSCEVRFEFEPKQQPSLDQRIAFEGTIDYIDPRGVVWDWKTTRSTFRFSRWEKQRYSPQATVYTAAAIDMGLAPGYPANFNYGVVSAKEGKWVIIEISRSAEHIRWLTEQCTDAVMLEQKLTLYRPWPRIDSHALCSGTWCPWWSICKGSFITDDANKTTIPYSAPTL